MSRNGPADLGGPSNLEGQSFAVRFLLLPVLFAVAIYLASMSFMIDSASADPATVRVDVGGGSSAVAIDTANGNAYVAATPSTVAVISGTTKQISISLANDMKVHDLEGIAFDPHNNYVYVTDRSLGIVHVIDGSSNMVFTQKINNLNAPTGIIYDSANHLIYVTNSKDNTVSVISGFTVINTIHLVPTGPGLNGITFDSHNGDVYVTNTMLNKVYAIPSSTNPVVTTISDPSRQLSGPEGLDFDLANNQIYVANYNTNSVAVIPDSSNSVLPTTIDVDQGPVSVAVDGFDGNIYVGTIRSNTLTVIAGSSNLVGGHIGVDPSPVAVAFNKINHYLYVATISQNTISILVVPITVPTGHGPTGMAFDEANGELYVANSLSDSVTVISLTNLVTYTIPFPPGSQPMGVAWGPFAPNIGSFIYVTNFGSNTVSVIRVSDNSIIKTITVGSEPAGIAFSGIGFIYVTNFSSGTVSVIDPTQNDKVVATIQVGFLPWGVTYNPYNTYMYVANIGLPGIGGPTGSSISVISGSRVVDTIQDIPPPFAITFDYSNDDMYVANAFSSRTMVTVIDTSSDAVVDSIPPAHIPSGDLPSAIAYNPLDHQIYVVNSCAGSVTVISDQSNKVVATFAIGPAPPPCGVSGGIVFANWLLASQEMIVAFPTSDNILIM